MLSDWAIITLSLGGRVGQCIWEFAAINYSLEGISPQISLKTGYSSVHTAGGAYHRR